MVSSPQLKFNDGFLCPNFAVFDRCHTNTDRHAAKPAHGMECRNEYRQDIGLPPNQDLVLDWLNRNNIAWRVYSDDLSFFALFLGCGSTSLQPTDSENLSTQPVDRFVVRR